MSEGESAKPALVLCAVLVVAGVAIAAIGGMAGGSIIGGVVAAAGAVPAGFAAWRGMQRQSQGPLVAALMALLLALGVGAVLVLLRLFHWFR